MTGKEFERISSTVASEGNENLVAQDAFYYAHMCVDGYNFPGAIHFMAVHVTPPLRSVILEPDPGTCYFTEFEVTGRMVMKHIMEFDMLVCASSDRSADRLYIAAPKASFDAQLMQPGVHVVLPWLKPNQHDWVVIGMKRVKMEKGYTKVTQLFDSKAVIDAINNATGKIPDGLSALRCM